VLAKKRWFHAIDDTVDPFPIASTLHPESDNVK
jgi:hypothetical protein